MARIEEDLDEYNKRLAEMKELQQKCAELAAEKSKLLDKMSETIEKINEINDIPLLTRIFRFGKTIKEILEDND